MKVVTKQIFHDKKEDVIRFEGAVFEVTEERLKEINQKLPGFVEVLLEADDEVEKPAKKPARKKKAVTDDGEA